MQNAECKMNGNAIGGTSVGCIHECTAPPPVSSQCTMHNDVGRGLAPAASSHQDDTRRKARQITLGGCLTSPTPYDTMKKGQRRRTWQARRNAKIQGAHFYFVLHSCRSHGRTLDYAAYLGHSRKTVCTQIFIKTPKEKEKTAIIAFTAAPLGAVAFCFSFV